MHSIVHLRDLRRCRLSDQSECIALKQTVGRHSELFLACYWRSSRTKTITPTPRKMATATHAFWEYGSDGYKPGNAEDYTQATMDDAAHAGRNW